MYQTQAFLSDWCHVLEIAKLDSGFCNKSNRDYFLEVIQKITISDGLNTNSAWYPFWIYLRKVGVSVVHLNLMGFNLASCYQGKTITSITLTLIGINAKNIVHIICLLNTCSKLKELNMQYISANVFLKIAGSITNELFENLSSISLDITKKVTDEKCMIISDFLLNHCGNLESLTLQLKLENTKIPLFFTDLMTKIRKLTLLKLNFGPQEFESIEHIKKV
jgi:hypothetical protein